METQDEINNNNNNNNDCDDPEAQDFIMTSESIMQQEEEEEAESGVFKTEEEEEEKDSATIPTTTTSATTTTTPKTNILLAGADDDEEEEEEEEEEENDDSPTTAMDTDPIHTSTITSTTTTNTTAATANSLSTRTPHPPTSSSSSTSSSTHHLLLSNIITPSPFSHHNDSTTSDRYRSALQRIQSSPLSDVEAWQAIMNECTSLYRTVVLPALEEERSTIRMLASSTLTTTPSNIDDVPNENAKEAAMVNEYIHLLHRMPRSTELESKLDWVESCHGHLLSYFPYCANYYVSVVEVLMARSALPFESLPKSDAEIHAGMGLDYVHISTPGIVIGGNVVQYGITEKMRWCEEKMERIFRLALGVEMDGSPVGTDEYFDVSLEEGSGHGRASLGRKKNAAIPWLGGMCTSSVDLWLLYIRKRSRDARRMALLLHPSSSSSSDAFATTSANVNSNTWISSSGEELIRNYITQAYETALQNGASFVYNNHLIWKQYLTFTKSWTSTSTSTSTTNTDPDVAVMDHTLLQTQKQHLRSIYQRLISLPMTGLVQLWMEYEQFEKAQSEQLASALIAENMPKYQHAKQVYLERNRVYNMHELRIGRLATPPVDLEYFGSVEDGGEDGGVSMGMGGIRVEEGVGVNRVVGKGGSGNTATTSVTGGPNVSVATSTSNASKSSSSTHPASAADVMLLLDPAARSEYNVKMKEELLILSKWKRRCGYERTNPERLSLADLAVRVRQVYKDAVCAFMRHLEVWHEWSTWELFQVGGVSGGAPVGSVGVSGSGLGVDVGAVANEGDVATGDASTLASGTVASSTVVAKRRNVQLAIAVLELAQRHIPDSSLLAYSQAQILESQAPFLGTSGGGGVMLQKSNSNENESAKAAIDVMVDFCNRAGNTLGYVLLQQLVRKYQGKKEARAVFAKARRELCKRREDLVGEVNGELLVGGGVGVGVGVGGTNPNESMDHHHRDGVAKSVVSTGASTLLNSSSVLTNGGSGRKMVMNRNMLQSTMVDGGRNGQLFHSSSNIDASSLPINLNDTQREGSKGGIGGRVRRKGFITWHLYAAHATMEQRLNNSPHIASRVYELGLKKHRSFLSTPPYVLQYASLLLELNDEENLRALLTRSIAACEEENIAEGDDSNMSKVISGRREAQRPLWDMMLKFEAILSSRSGDFSTVQNIEARRRKALYGPNNEDVAGGNASGIDGSDVGIGMHKSSLSETLIRTDGYDVSSRISNGLHRLVDSLETMGILYGGEIVLTPTSIAAMSAGSIWKDDGAGGLSDSSFRRRTKFQSESEALSALPETGVGMIGAGMAGVTAVGGTGTTTGKFLSAKERYMSQSLAQSASAAIQSSPEWLRGLLTLLPSTKYRGAKAPPHMIEMAVVALRDGDLPSVRPLDEVTSTSASTGATTMSNGLSLNSTKRKRDMNDNSMNGGNGGDSSDEENGYTYGGGYGTQFRARQRARMIEASSSALEASSGNTGSGGASLNASGAMQ